MKNKYQNTNGTNADVYSAGILLYHNDKTQNETYFLLGKDKKYEKWSDFGGKCEYSDNGNMIKTAAREFYEETCGSIFCITELTYMLRNCTYLVCSSYNKNPYYMFILNINDSIYKNIQQIDFTKNVNFMNTNKILPYKFKEKQEMRWFSASEIIENDSEMRNVFLKSFVNNINKIKECVSFNKQNL